MKKSNSKITKLSSALLIGGFSFITTNCLAQEDGIRKKDSVELEKCLKDISIQEDTNNLLRAFPGDWYTNVLDTMKAEPYICPICGKKTYDANIYNKRIKYIRLKIAQIKLLGYDVILDESEFCDKCDGFSEYNPKLIFKIRFSKNANYHVYKSNYIDDYICLLEFLIGKDYYVAEEEVDGCIAIHLKVYLIRKMTGLGTDLVLHKHYGIYHKDEYIEVLKKEWI